MWVMEIVKMGPEHHELLVESRMLFTGNAPGTLPSRLAEGLMFGVLAFTDGELVGYRVQQHVAHKIAGFGTMAVHPDWRGKGLGRKIVEAHHAAAPEIETFIVFNSNPPKERAHLVPEGAEQFWVSCGYRVVARSSEARVLCFERFSN